MRNRIGKVSRKALNIVRKTALRLSPRALWARFSIERWLTPRAALFWALSAVILCLIFVFGGQSGEDSGAFSGKIAEILHVVFPFLGDDLDAIHFAVRKLAHFSIFLLLGVFAFQFLATIPIKWGLRIGICILFIALYAVSDEVHQFFTDGRSMMVFDMLVDTAGGTLGTFVSAVFSLLPENRKLREYTEKEVNQ